MSHTTRNLLKKINYIEADIEIHKQILFSIPSDKRDEIENTLQIIADKKEEITQLRGEIQKIDPEEFKQILVFEKAINDFKKIAAKKNFQSIVSKNSAEQCTLILTNKTEIECLIKACDESGDWTIITLVGDINSFAKDDVSEKL
jgi:biotin-(acetyl-CoA carboxylase) ligase